MTPKEIDEAVKRISYTLSEGINQFGCREDFLNQIINKKDRHKLIL